METLWLRRLWCWSIMLVAVAAHGGAGQRQVNVGVVLDLGSWVGQLGLSCINLAVSDFNSSNATLVLNVRDSKQDVVVAAAAVLDLIKNVKVEAIIGPQNSMEAPFVTELGTKSQVPIISYSASSPSLTSLRSPYFFQATQNDSSQVRAISAIVAAFGWRQAVPVYIDNDYGAGIVPYLIDALQEVNARVPYRSVIPALASDDQITSELYKLMTMQTRVFVVHMPPALGARLFAKAKQIGMMSQGYVWILTDGITNVWSQIDGSHLESMQGVLGVGTYVPKSYQLDKFKLRWQRKFQQDNPNVTKFGLDIFGLWAYDATRGLAAAIGKQGNIISPTFINTNLSSNATTDLERFGVFQNGPALVDALLNTRFNGLTGSYGYVNGQILSSTFQIINVNGNGAREVGIWTPQDGLLPRLNYTNETSFYSTSKDNLGPIIWPGDSTSIPKGWELPTNGKKLRILVPVKDGFSEFVTVTRDNGTNSTSVAGYCIDIFEAVIQALPYSVSYEFIPFANADGQMAGTYNDMIYQVYLGNYDAAVGDTTIVANRSRFVDFTLPYTESGVTMVVPITDQRPKNAWVFLKPLTLGLWATSGCFFVFIGFVVWVLEHRGNPHFRGPRSHQVGTSLWFAFSTMVFSHREKVISNLARTVVVIWCFVVLILTQSYTASLTSLLTVQQLQPTVTDVNQLLKSSAYIGYQDESFVVAILKGMGFSPAKFRAYSSVEDLDALFRNGSIAAAFDEIPYLKLLLAKYCNKYTTLEPTFKTDGFGFAFPKGSPIVPDISSAILNVTEDDQKMKEIENAWFSKEAACADSSSSISSNNLGLDSFWGLFLIAGVATISALLISLAMFLFENRQIFFNSETSMADKARAIIEKFNEEDKKSPAFKKKKKDDGEAKTAEDNPNAASGEAVGPPPNTNGPMSPSTISQQSIVISEKGGTSSPEHLDGPPSSPSEIQLATEETQTSRN